MTAHLVGAQPQRGRAGLRRLRVLEGLEKRKFGIAPELNEHVARRMKDEAEIERQRHKAQELKGPAGAPKALAKK